MLLELWERALKSEHGIAITSNNRPLLRQHLYQAELAMTSSITLSWSYLSNKTKYGWCTEMRAVSEPITKVTLNLYSRDVDWFKRHHPDAYTEAIREALRRHINYMMLMESSDPQF
jgi:hypothetical protein